MLLLLLLCLSWASGTVGQDSWSAFPWWGATGLRDRKDTASPVALTRNFVFSIGASSTIVARNWRQRGVLAWTSAPVPGLSSNVPTLSTAGVGSSDVVYFLNRADGKIYAFAPSQGSTKPLWKSSEVCSTKKGQDQQVITVDADAGLLVARCNATLVVVQATTGEFVAVLQGQTIDSKATNMIWPFPDPSTLVTWKGNTVNLWSVAPAAPGQLLRAIKMPNAKYQVNSVVAGPNFLVVTGKNSGTVYVVSNYGNTIVSYTASLPGTAGAVAVTGRPTLVGSDLYALVLGQAAPPPPSPPPSPSAPRYPGWSTPPPGPPFVGRRLQARASGSVSSGASFTPVPVWSLVALNLADPANIKLKFRNNPEPGSPPAQTLQYSSKFIYVSQPDVPVFSGYNLSTGELGWDNVRWPGGWPNPGVASVSYCCDQLFVSTNTGSKGSASQVTTFVYVILPPNGASYPPVDPAKCYCQGEPPKNY